MSDTREFEVINSTEIEFEMTEKIRAYAQDAIEFAEQFEGYPQADISNMFGFCNAGTIEVSVTDSCIFIDRANLDY